MTSPCQLGPTELIHCASLCPLPSLRGKHGPHTRHLRCVSEAQVGTRTPGRSESVALFSPGRQSLERRWWDSNPFPTLQAGPRRPSQMRAQHFGRWKLPPSFGSSPLPNSWPGSAVRPDTPGAAVPSAGGTVLSPQLHTGLGGATACSRLPKLFLAPRAHKQGHPAVPREKGLRLGHDDRVPGPQAARLRKARAVPGSGDGPGCAAGWGGGTQP